jgi:hypothetical protein
VYAHNIILHPVIWYVVNRRPPWQKSRRVEKFREIQRKADLGFYMIEILESRDIGVNIGFKNNRIREDLDSCIELIQDFLSTLNGDYDNECMRTIINNTGCTARDLEIVAQHLKYYRDELVLDNIHNSVKLSIRGIERQSTKQVRKLKADSSLPY